MTPTLKRPADLPVVIPCWSARIHYQIRGIGNRPRVTHAVPGDAALFPSPGGEQTVLAVCGTATMFPAPSGRRPPLFPVSVHRSSVSAAGTTICTRTWTRSARCCWPP